MSEWNVAAPLVGLRVAEFGDLIAVPYAGKILRGLIGGRETLKLEVGGRRFIQAIWSVFIGTSRHRSVRTVLVSERWEEKRRRRRLA